MILLLVSFVAGVLTVLAPCVLPLLPVIIGSSVSGNRKSKPYIIALSLSISIIIFTFVLKVSTIFIDIPQHIWNWISGGIIILFGLVMLFPTFWEKATIKFNLIVGRKSNKVLFEGVQKENIKGDVIIGAALGPVFSTCSPTYFVILATVLPQSFLKGFVYLLAYVIGLSLMLLLISLIGQKFVNGLEGASNPHGKFKKGLGVLFILVGIFVISGIDKKIQTFVVQSGVFDITKVEEKLLKLNEKETETETKGVVDDSSLKNTETNEVIDGKAQEVSSEVQRIIAEKNKKYKKFIDISNPSGFVNSGAIKLKDYVGKKVILVDFMTYSCINCQRTFPYLKAWNETYEKDGLLIVGIHTPEFAFEKKKENVENAMRQFGLNFPIVLDNDYGTWNAYGNSYWPRKYLIDIDGFVVYDHIGEGEYDTTEKKIQELLKEKSLREGQEMKDKNIVSDGIKEVEILSKSPETYFGSLRNTNLANGDVLKSGVQNFGVDSDWNVSKNKLYLEGSWNIDKEYARSIENAKVFFRFEASKVFIVADNQVGGSIEVYRDGKFVKKVEVKDSKLYTLINENEIGSGVLELRISPKTNLYAFTFG